MGKVTTAWGATTVVEEVAIPQRAGEKEFAALVQLLAGEDGARYVRFAYTTDGQARRGPVTLRAEDLAQLRAALGDHAELADALGLARRGGSGGGGRRR